MALLKKAILKVGETMHSPDRAVPITAERLAHFAAEHKRLASAGYDVPSRWEHASDHADMIPLSTDDFKKKLDGRHAVGRMVGFDYQPGADQAEITLEITDPRAVEQCESNRVKVSPIIADGWMDGHKNKYTDFISHMDLVERPVDYSQGPFEPVPGMIACSLETAVRLAFPDDESEQPEAGEKPAEPAAPPAEPERNPDAPPKATDKSKAAAVVEGFKSLGVVLPSDFDLKDDNAVDLLLTGLNTLIAAKVKAETEAQERETEQDDAPETVASPGYAAMSTETKATVEYVERMHRQNVQKRLDALLESGRCTPDEARQRKEGIGTVRLSLDAEQKPILSDLEKWIDSREPLPAGTFWTDAQKTKLSTEVAQPPENMGGEPSDDDYAKRAQDQLRRHGYIRQ